MPLIRMRTTLAGPKYNCFAGKVVNVDNAFAETLIKKGYAEPVETASQPEIETATIGPEGNEAIRTRPPEPKNKRKRSVKKS